MTPVSKANVKKIIFALLFPFLTNGIFITATEHSPKIEKALHNWIDDFSRQHFYIFYCMYCLLFASGGMVILSFLSVKPAIKIVSLLAYFVFVCICMSGWGLLIACLNGSCL